MAITPFKSQIVDVGGKPMTVDGLRKKQDEQREVDRRRAEIELRKRERIANAEAEEAEAKARLVALQLAETQAVHDEKNAATTKVESEKADRERAKLRIKRNRRLVVTAVVVLCAIIELGGQLMFFLGYLDTWPAQFRGLLYFAPVVVPTFSWGFGLDGYFRAKDRAPYGKSMMVMWLSAIAAAIMIATDLFLLLGNPFWPAFVGSASIAGPAIFHWHVGSVSQDAHGISPVDRAREIVRKWINRIRHPFIWWAATDLHHSSMGAVSYEHAWLMAYRQKKGHLPGLLPVYIPDVQVRRLKWLRRVLDRVVFGTSNVSSNVSPGNVLSNVAAGRHAIESPATSADVAPDSNVPPSNTPGNVAPPESEVEVTMPMGTLLSEVESYLSGKGLDVAPRDVAGAYQDADTLLATRLRSSGDVARPGATSETKASNVAPPMGQSNVSTGNVAHRQPRGGNVGRREQKSNVALFRRNGATSGYGVAATLVREYVDRLLASGVPIDEIYGSAAAEMVNPQLVAEGLKPIKRQAAARTIKEYREKLAAQAAERREA